MNTDEKMNVSIAPVQKLQMKPPSRILQAEKLYLLKINNQC